MRIVLATLLIPVVVGFVIPHAPPPRCMLAPRLFRANTCMASDGPDTKGNTFELCVLDDSGMIDECLIVSEDELPEHFDPEQIDKLRAGEDDLIFINGKRGSCSKKVDESPDILTLAEVRKCVDDEECEIPNDVMLKALGPDARQVISDITGREVTVSADASNRGSDSDTRYHLHFGAGRLGMGLVVPAIAASGIPFAVIQRAKPRWISLFGQAGDGTKENQLGVSVNEQARRHLRAPRLAALACRLTWRVAFGQVCSPPPGTHLSRADGRPQGRHDRVRRGHPIHHAAAVAHLWFDTRRARRGCRPRNVTLMLPRIGQCARGDASRTQHGGARREAPARMAPLAPPAAQTPVVCARRGPLDLTRSRPISSDLALAVGDVMLPLLEPLPLVAKERQPRLFCCENDHDAVAKLKKQLEGRVHVIDCMVDRVCTARAPARRS